MFVPLRIRNHLKMAPTRNRGPISDWETDSLDQQAFSLGRSKGGSIVSGRNKQRLRPTEEKRETRETYARGRASRVPWVR